MLHDADVIGPSAVVVSTEVRVASFSSHQGPARTNGIPQQDTLAVTNEQQLANWDVSFAARTNPIGTHPGPTDRPLEIDHAVSIVGISTALPSPLALVPIKKKTHHFGHQSERCR